MKKISLILAILFFSWSSFAQSLTYLKGGLGSSSQHSNTYAGGDIDYGRSALGAFSLAFGLNIGPQFMTELELSTRHSELKDVNGTSALGDLSSGLLALNAFYKLPVTHGYSLLFGGGIGTLNTELTDDLTGNYADGNAFATQWIAGFEGEVTSNLDVSFELRYLGADDMRLDGTSGAFGEPFDYSNTSFLVGLKYNF